MDMIILTARTRTEFVIRLREAFNAARNAMSEVLDGTTFADLVEMQRAKADGSTDLLIADCEL